MKRILQLLLLLLLPAMAVAQNDPCLSPSVLKQQVVVASTTAATTQLVALVANQRVWVCGGALTIASSLTTADTIQFEYGTGASCGTGTTVITGAFGAGVITAAAGTLVTDVSLSGGPAQLTVPPGNALCIVTAGTTINIQGYVSYVQEQ